MIKELRYVRKIVYILLILALSVTLFSLFWNIKKENEEKYNYAKIECDASYNKDILYRKWTAMHGGVYVPITKLTPPNPYLSHIPDRDITTEKGKKLTLINPAYLISQVYELSKKTYGVKGHITSLNPLRPENKPDEWETKILKKFNEGIKECYEITTMDGKEHLRYMRSMIVEDMCLKCHAAQGYKTGDVRGGISISVPMEKYNKIAKERINSIIQTHIIVFIFIVAIAIILFYFLKKEIKRRIGYYKKVIESEAELKSHNEEYIALNEEFKSQNEELISAKEKAEESDKLKSAFLQNISHEIRTPLNAICGFTQLLKVNNLNEKKRKGFISIINNSSDQLLNLVSDIITLSSLETNQEKINTEKVSINSIIYELLDIFKHNNEKNENVTINAKAGLENNDDVIYTDRAKIIQILSNLLSNAIKFTEKGFVEFGYILKNEFLEFYVKDSGIGIEHVVHNKIFDRFTQAELDSRKTYGGTGLGLSISKGLVNLLGGEIRLESEPNKGSIFYFTIPYNKVEETNIPEIKQDKLFKPENIKTILIAEDEKNNLKYLKELLISKGFNIIHADNGEKAIEICNENDEIKLVLMDIKMPVIDGYEATKIIKQNRSDIIIIAQTAYALDHEIERFGGIFDDYITKPIEKNKLFKILSKYLNI